MKHNIKIRLHLLYSKEKVKEDIQHFFYSPALDLYGYGYSEEEAKESFIAHLDGFIDYTLEKKTFFKELKRLGWHVKDNKQVEPPPVPVWFNRPDTQALLTKQPLMSEISKRVSV